MLLSMLYNFIDRIAIIQRILEANSLRNNKLMVKFIFNVNGIICFYIGIVRYNKRGSKYEKANICNSYYNSGICNVYWSPCLCYGIL